ncbi:MAG: dockerin type I repeat-containing protein [Clostridia bacterium]|nr:dockerin type I repeat-containing protein [Clostridia bacterium]
MKKVLCALLAVVTLLSVVAVPFAVAEDVPAGEYGVNYVKYGDVNYDEAVSAADALLILQSVVGKTQFDEHKQKVGDVNADTLVSAADALQILQMVVGKIAAFKAGQYYMIQPVDDGGSDTPVDPDPPAPIEDYIANYDKSASTNGA